MSKTTRAIGQRKSFTKASEPAPFKVNRFEVSRLVKVQTDAVTSGVWDYPMDYKFANSGEVWDAVNSGKSVQMFVRQCMVEFGTITGALLGSQFNHVSHSSKHAIRKGVMRAQQYKQIIEQLKAK
jgi:hypothetical protein